MLGGYVLEYHGLKATQDVDALYQDSQKVRELIFQVGEAFGINTQDELWFNNHVSNLNRQPSEDICDTLYDFEYLTVLVVPLEYVLGMKMESARQQDLKDIGAIIKHRQL